MNLTWLVVPLGLVISTILVIIWVYLGVSDTPIVGLPSRFHDQYPIACALIGLSSITQMIEEPVYLLSARELKATPKIVSETSMLLFRYAIIKNLYGSIYGSGMFLGTER